MMAGALIIINKIVLIKTTRKKKKSRDENLWQSFFLMNLNL